ncbi:MAG: mercuric transport protein MerTP [Filimonas sp.]|nr:mercuric transport protein MerTP [Filimonas sp.]
MISEKNNKALLGSGLLLSLTSSLCCITPLLALISGTGSTVAAFSWAEPLRPYLLVATILVLGIAFYQAYKPKQKDECGCAGEERKKGLQSKSFLWIVAILSLSLSTFPYYAKYLQPKPVIKSIAATDSTHIQQAIISLSGMNCEACEGHVNNALLHKKGVQQVNTSYSNGTSTVKFDSTIISLSQLAATIENETGYKVTYIKN